MKLVKIVSKTEMKLVGSDLEPAFIRDVLSGANRLGLTNYLVSGDSLDLSFVEGTKLEKITTAPKSPYSDHKAEDVMVIDADFREEVLRMMISNLEEDTSFIFGIEEL